MPDSITLVATSFEDTLTIPLDCVRNQNWNPVFTITDCNGNIIDLTGYGLALVVVPVNFDGSFGAPAWTCAVFNLQSDGSAQFSVLPVDTGKLLVSGSYQWFLKSTAPGAPGSNVVLAGPLNVFDSPVPASGNGSGGTAPGLSGTNDGDLNAIYIKDDLEFPNVGSTVNALLARWITTPGVSFVDLKDNTHWGVWKLAPGASNSITLNQFQNLYALSSVQKAIMRVVCMPDRSPETGTHEWYAGFFYTVIAGYPSGILLSQAEGYTGLPLANGGSGNVDCTTGLVAGTYNGTGSGGASELGYLQTGFLPAANQWVDLIIVWTPAQCRFYCAPEGSAPVLLAAINTTIPVGFAPPAIIQNNSDLTNLYVDRIEISYLFKTSFNRFEGNSKLITL